ncbi:MAG: S8 family serine peptidase [Pseudomonadota bacterium]
MLNLRMPLRLNRPLPMLLPPPLNFPLNLLRFVVLLLACAGPAAALAQSAGAAVPAAPAQTGPASAPDSAAVPDAAPAQVLVMLHLPAPHYRADGAYAGGYGGAEGGQAARRRIASELARAHGLTLVSDWPMPVLGVDCYVLALPPHADPVQVAALLAKDARVEWAQAVTSFHTLGQGDPLYPVQPSALAWHLSELHRASTGRRVLVAVIDSGVDGAHPDLAGQVATSANFIDGDPYLAENHGTAVAGIIAAHADNGIGIRGVAPGVRLLALRACHERGQGGAQCNSFSLGKALHFAIMHDANVINLSLSGPPDRLVQRLLEAAQARGIKVVGAVDGQLGNGGFPASLPGVFAAGVARGEMASALLAPGRDIPTTLPGARFGFVTGSSYSAAHLSGLLALMGELRPDDDAAQAQAMLRSVPDGLARAGASGGALDACAVLASAAHACVCACAGARLTALTNLSQP